MLNELIQAVLSGKPCSTPHSDDLAWRARDFNIFYLNTLWVHVTMAERCKLASNWRIQRRRLGEERNRQRAAEHQRAYVVYRRALKQGIIVSEPCLACGELKTAGHHWDYSKPLDVIWYCAVCHTKLHANLNKLLIQQTTAAMKNIYAGTTAPSLYSRHQYHALSHLT